MLKVEEDEESLPKTPNRSVGERNLCIHTPRVEHPIFDNSAELFDPVKQVKEKDRELLEMADYKRAELFVDEQEKKRIQEMETEYAVLKEQVAEISVMRAEIEMMKREMREKDEKVAKIEREKYDIESNSAGLEMQFEQLKHKMTNREKELLAVIENSGENGLNGIKESLAKMKKENDQLKMEIEREKFARSDESSKSEKMIASLRDEINHSAKARHETEANLWKKIRTLEANENFEKITKMEEDTKDLRDQILILQKTISVLEQEKLELSMKGTEAPSVCLASGETLKDISTDMDISLQSMDETLRAENTLQLSIDNQSLLDMDQTLLCALVCNGKSDSYTQKNPTVALELPKTEKKHLLDKIERLSGQLNESMQEIEKLSNQLSESIQENEKLSSQLLESAQENDALKQNYEKILTEESFKTSRIQANFDRLENAYGRLEDELKESEASVQILQKEKDYLLEERDSTKDQWSQQKLELEMKVTYHSDKAARCEEKIMELNKQIGELVLKSEDMKNKLEMSEIQLNGNIDLNTDYDDLMQKYKVVSMENNKSKTRIQDLQERNEKLKLKSDALLFEVESLREKVASDYCILEEKDNHIDQLQKNLREQVNLVASLEDQVKNVKPKLIMDEAAIEDLEKAHKNELAKITESHNKVLEQLAVEKKDLENDYSKAKAMFNLMQQENNNKMLFHAEKMGRLHDQLFKNNVKLDDLMRENANLKQTLDDSRENIRTIWELRQQLAEYRDTETELSQERNILKSRVEEVSKQCIQLENEKLTLQKELESAKGEFDAILREKLDHSNVEIGQLRERLQCSEGEVDKLTKRLNKLELEEREMIKTIESIQNSHENQVKEIKCNAEVKQKQLQDEKDQLSRINNQLETIIKDLKSVLVELKEDFTKTEKDLQNERESKENLEKEIEKIRQLHREEIMTIKTEAAENSKSKEEINMLKGVLATKNIDFEQLSSNYDNILQKFNELERQNELNLSEIESLRQNISHLSHVAGEKDKEMDELRLKLKEETDQINGLTDKLAKFSDLKEELQVAKDENNNLKDEIVSVKSLAENRRDEIAELQQKLCEKVIKISHMEEKFSKEKAQVSLNDAQVAELKKENDEIVKEYKIMKKNYDKKIKSLKDANDFIATQRDDLKSKLHDRENAIGSKEKEIELLKGCVKKKEKSIEKLNGLLKEKMTEINELKVNRKFDRVTGRSSSPTTMEVIRKEKRKSDRQSLYDINRSIQFEVERDVGTMTDPTSDSCQCQFLAEKITNLKREIIVMEYKLSDTARNMEKDALKNDMQMLQLEMVKKDQAIRTMSEDLVKRQQELSEKEAEMKRIHHMRINSSTILHTASQTEQLGSRCGTLDSGVILRAELEETRRQLKSLQDRYEKLQDEWQTKSEVAESAMEEQKTKYNNLKRAFFKLKQKYEDH
ncbi:putative leucine-rich repeat-containing protein DDB_G0290503 isoform X2 [Phlebotomus papatasi]|uniref:putative leucine-rich repeat-containing protein DDB_G0290503 isoform X2 n=1 Tax=Phlebotomus papatasi TaxID=29031 RepID=UPI002483BD50|nr:putative leucine-rich repeat-containing protein DDB_G0290503 isoform X2 [Phlebotomus papatasi]